MNVTLCVALVVAFITGIVIAWRENWGALLQIRRCVNLFVIACILLWTADLEVEFASLTAWFGLLGASLFVGMVLADIAKGPPQKGRRRRRVGK
jgi:hypothetical protein